MANGRRRRRAAAPRIVTSRIHAGHGLRVVHAADAEGRVRSSVQEVRRPRVAHFDHDGCPRVTPSRGAAAHGFFQLYASCADLTQALFLCDPAARTPAFVRFSSVLAARRGADTVRDVRSFAVKLFTAEGNFDLVGQSFPVLHLADGVRFPDSFFARAPDALEAPFDAAPSLAPVRAAIWEYACGAPSAAAPLLWLLSERGLPRSLRMMAGYGVHTYRLVDAAGQARLCKFHWRPLLGAHALDPDEAELLAEEDPDFHRRDLWEAIEDGDFPEWELAVQVIDEERARALGIDVLDATQDMPLDEAPLRAVGKLTLTRNTVSFYKDVEELDFHPSRTVPGIDFTDDPSLQARLLTDVPPTPGFIDPVRAPLARPARRATVQADPCAAAARFYRGLSSGEQRRLVDAITDDLRDLPRATRTSALGLLQRIDAELARRVAGRAAPVAATLAATLAPRAIAGRAPLRSRRVAVLVADGVRAAHLDPVLAALAAEHAHVDLVARVPGSVVSAEGQEITVDHSHRTASSIFYDAVFIPGGGHAVEAMLGQAAAIHFIEEAFRHGKPIGVLGEARDLVAASSLPEVHVHHANGSADDVVVSFDGVVSGSGGSADEVEAFARELVDAMQQHRFFERAPVVGRVVGRRVES